MKTGAVRELLLCCSQKGIGLQEVVSGIYLGGRELFGGRDRRQIYEQKLICGCGSTVHKNTVP